MSIFVSAESEEVFGWVVSGGNGKLICDLWLLCGVSVPVHKLLIPSGSHFYECALVTCDFVLELILKINIAELMCYL